jgi:hypothetical protein
MTAPSPAHDRWWARPLWWVELFALSNVAFLAVDVYLAHSINAFAQRAEWAPIAFSLAAPVVFAFSMLLGGPTPSLMGDESPGLRVQLNRIGRWLGLVVGWGSLAVGIAGLLLHLESQFFKEQTLKNLVYTAPFVAPLSYAGLGLLIVLNRMVDARSIEWARWVVLLALGGFAGNFVLCLADHAQNGFFHPAEWTGVIASAMAIGSLLAVLLIYDNRPLLRLCGGVMVAQAAVGVLGFFFHAAANLAQPVGSLWEKFLYGAPLFAPLLFPDLALLAVIALWALVRDVARNGQ